MKLVWGHLLRLWVRFVRKKEKQLLFVSVIRGKPKFTPFRGYETRNESTAKLIAQALGGSLERPTETFFVNTGDRPIERWRGIRTFHYSTTTDDYSRVCPDFLFDSWKQVGISDFEKVCREIEVAGELPPQTGRLGWIGSPMVDARRHLISISEKYADDIEAISMDWIRTNPDRLEGTTYLSLPQQVLRWKYLIDVEGIGYSARLKLLFHSRRAIFISERPWKEWFFQYLEPWKHYVPVKRDLSDLVENLNRVNDDESLAAEIAREGFEFGRRFLTRQNAQDRWRELLIAE